MTMGFDMQRKGAEQNRASEADVRLLNEVLFDLYSTLSVEQKREALEHHFRSAEVPHAAVDRALLEAGGDEQGAAIVWKLAETFGAPVLPWAEKFLTSTDDRARTRAALALTFIDEQRGVDELIKIFEQAASLGRESNAHGGPLRIMVDCLEGIESPKVRAFKNDFLGPYLGAPIP